MNAGWHPDPTGAFQHRYHNGTDWTDDVATDGQQSKSPMAGVRPVVPPPPAASVTPVAAAPAKGKGCANLIGIVVAIIVAVVVIAAVAGGGSKKGSKSAAKTPNGASSCGFKATDSCIPDVTGTHRVRVDALIWHVLAPPVIAPSIGGTPSTHGVYLVVMLEMHSDRSSEADMTDDVVHLVNGKKSFGADPVATEEAAANSSVKNITGLSITQVQPDDRLNMIVVFDVPKSALVGNPQLRFNELGLGTTRAYIQIKPRKL